MRSRQPEIQTQTAPPAVLPGWVLRLHELDLAEFCRACVRELPVKLGCTGATLYLHEPAAHVLRLAESSAAGMLETVLSLNGDSPAAQAARVGRETQAPAVGPATGLAAGGPAALAATHQAAGPASPDPAATAAQAGEAGAEPLRALPLQAGGRLQGVLYLHGALPAEAPGGPVEMPLLIDFLGRSLHHARVFEQVSLEARVDCLTGLYNLRWLQEQMAQELSRVERFGGPLSVLTIDIDGLKSINDQAGHAAGDCVLRHVAARVRAALRQIDCAARVGGDEFVVILPGTDAAGAAHVAERISRLISRELCCFRDRTLQVTASIGLAEWQAGWSAEQLLEAADHAMYGRKRSAPPETSTP